MAWSPEPVGRWCRLWLLVLTATVLVLLLGAAAWAVLYTERSTTALVALASLACGWLLVFVDRLPP